MVQPARSFPGPRRTAGSSGLSWVPGFCSPPTNLLTRSLGQDKLELELVLKGSYEDTQTSALGTASSTTFSFHYLAAQDSELSVCLRVGLSSPVLHQPQP
jgi:hypothetical protein